MKDQVEKGLIFFRPVFLVAKRDFRHLFLSPLFFIWAGVSCILLSFVFLRALFFFSDMYSSIQSGPGGNIHEALFSPYISFVHVILIFSLPALSMKLLAEEKQNHTFDLLMTSPLSSLQMVLGKYAALLSSLALFLGFAFFYPLSSAFFADLSWGTLFGSWTGVFLLSAVYGAAGLLASSLSASLFLSAFVSLILNIGILVVFQRDSLTGIPLPEAVLDYLALDLHFDRFLEGSFSLSSFVFFFCLIIFFIFLVFKSVEITRWRS